MKVGDVVGLKSGGPDMTIEKIMVTQVDCVWFRDREVYRGSFVLETMEPRTVKHGPPPAIGPKVSL